MPYFPPKETRRRMSLKEVEAIVNQYFGRWFTADVKYELVDGYYYELTCPVCNSRIEDYLWEDEKGKEKNRWMTCPKCDSRYDYNFCWYKDDKVRFKLNLEGTTLNIEVPELEAMYKDEDY